MYIQKVLHIYGSHIFSKVFLLFEPGGPSMLPPGAPPTLDPATALRLGLPSPTQWAAMAAAVSAGGEGFMPTPPGGSSSSDPRMPTPYPRDSRSSGPRIQQHSRYDSKYILILPLCKDTLLGTFK